MSRVVLVFLAFLAPATVEASTIVVKPGTPIATIQQGINAAANGSTVKVMPGVYTEAVKIPLNKSNVTLLGVGKVVLDARGPGGAALGPAIDIVANGVTVKGLVIRHALTLNGAKGRGITAVGNGLRFEKLRIEHSNEHAMFVSGHDAVVRGCVFVANETAIQIEGDRARIEKNDVRMDGSDGVVVHGADAIVLKNSFKNVEDGSGVVVLGANARVESNLVRCVESYGIDVNGDSGVIRKNHVAFTRNSIGIYAAGQSVLVESNLVEQVGAELIVLAGPNGIVRKNVVRGSGQDTFAIEATGIGIEITRNQISEGFGGGILFGSMGGKCVTNTIARCGFEGEHAIATSGAASALIAGNHVTDCGDGIEAAAAPGITISDNTVVRSAIDGIHVAPTAMSASVTGNVVRDCGAEGIDNRALGVVLTGNVLKKNRIDLANAGTFATNSANVFATGGVAATPEID